MNKFLTITGLAIVWIALCATFPVLGAVTVVALAIVGFSAICYYCPFAAFFLMMS